jgi:prevent-host-death family protein
MVPLKSIGGSVMNFTEDIRSISYVKSHTAEVIKRIEEANSPMIITQNGEAKAVLMDVKQYQNIVDSINLLKILSIGEKDLKNKKIYTHGELQKKIKSILG